MVFHARCEKCGTYEQTQPGYMSYPVPALPEGWHRVFMQDDAPNRGAKAEFTAAICAACSRDVWGSIERQLKFRTLPEKQP